MIPNLKSNIEVKWKQLKRFGLMKTKIEENIYNKNKINNNFFKIT